MNYWKLMLLLCFLALGMNVQGQSLEKRPIELSFEYQMYPAGMIPGLKVEVGVGQYFKHSMSARLCYHRVRRHGWGKHGDERGNGFGASIGYKYYIIKPMKGLYTGARASVSKLTIDYRDIGDDEIFGTEDDGNFGQSKVVVIQPTIEFGYKFLFPIGRGKILFITPQIAAGFEYNAITDGEAVGKGATGLWGVDIGLRF